MGNGLSLQIAKYILRVLPSEKSDVPKGPSGQFLRGLFS